MQDEPPETAAIAAASDRGWTPERRQLFLETLSETCNVRAAVAATGMSSSGLYYLRNRDPDFADQWQEALVIAYDRLEQALVRHALRELGEIDSEDVPHRDHATAPVAGNPGTGLPPVLQKVDFQLALLLLNRHRSAVEGRGGPRRAKRPTPEQTDALLRKKLDALARRLRGEA